MIEMVIFKGWSGWIHGDMVWFPSRRHLRKDTSGGDFFHSYGGNFWLEQVLGLLYHLQEADFCGPVG